MYCVLVSKLIFPDSFLHQFSSVIHCNTLFFSWHFLFHLVHFPFFDFFCLLSKDYSSHLTVVLPLQLYFSPSFAPNTWHQPRVQTQGHRALLYDSQSWKTPHGGCLNCKRVWQLNDPENISLSMYNHCSACHMGNGYIAIRESNIVDETKTRALQYRVIINNKIHASNQEHHRGFVGGNFIVP